MSAYSVLINVANAAYGALSAPSVTIPFQPKTITIVNEDDVDSVDVSFDGVDTHATLVPAKPDAGMVFRQSVTRVWLKYTAVPAGTLNVRVMAES